MNSAPKIRLQIFDPRNSARANRLRFASPKVNYRCGEFKFKIACICAILWFTTSEGLPLSLSANSWNCSSAIWWPKNFERKFSVLDARYACSRFLLDSWCNSQFAARFSWPPTQFTTRFSTDSDVSSFREHNQFFGCLFAKCYLGPKF